ncbi:MAG: NAD(P)-binding domain-containing protein [Microbacterium sp.]
MTYQPRFTPTERITVTTIAVLGAGRVGSAIARTAMDAGFEVNLAASGPAEVIALLAEIVTPGARAMTAADAVQGADIVVVAVPLHKHRTIDGRREHRAGPGEGERQPDGGR